MYKRLVEVQREREEEKQEQYRKIDPHLLQTIRQGRVKKPVDSSQKKPKRAKRNIINYVDNGDSQYQQGSVLTRRKRKSIVTGDGGEQEVKLEDSIDLKDIKMEHQSQYS